MRRDALGKNCGGAPQKPLRAGGWEKYPLFREQSTKRGYFTISGSRIEGGWSQVARRRGIR